MADQRTDRALHFVVDIQADNKEAAAKALRAAADSAERGVVFGAGIGHGYDYSIDRAPSVPVVRGSPEPKPPCAVCGTPYEKHGTAPTCASHDYTDGGHIVLLVPSGVAADDGLDRAKFLQDMERNVEQRNAGEPGTLNDQPKKGA